MRVCAPSIHIVEPGPVGDLNIIQSAQAAIPAPHKQVVGDVLRGESALLDIKGVKLGDDLVGAFAGGDRVVVVGFVAQGEDEGGVGFHSGVVGELEEKRYELVSISISAVWT